MRAFHELFRALDATTRSSVKERHLVAYFEAAPPEDAAWAAHLLLGRKGRRAVNTRLLREWAAEESGHPLWLVEESYDAVGDLAETALLLSNADERPELPALAAFMSERVMALAELDEDAKRALSRAPGRSRRGRALPLPQAHLRRLPRGRGEGDRPRPSPESRASTARRSSTGSAASGSRPRRRGAPSSRPRRGTPIPCGPIPSSSRTLSRRTSPTSAT